MAIGPAGSRAMGYILGPRSGAECQGVTSMMNRFGVQEHSYQSKLDSYVLSHNDHPHGHELAQLHATKGLLE